MSCLAGKKGEERTGTMAGTALLRALFEPPCCWCLHGARAGAPATGREARQDAHRAGRRMGAVWWVHPAQLSPSPGRCGGDTRHSGRPGVTHTAQRPPRGDTQPSGYPGVTHTAQQPRARGTQHLTAALLLGTLTPPQYAGRVDGTGGSVCVCKKLSILSYTAKYCEKLNFRLSSTRVYTEPEDGRQA